MNKINIEIDLEDILCERNYEGEYEPIEDTIGSMKRQISDNIRKYIEDKWLKEFKQELKSSIQAEIYSKMLEQANTYIPEIIETLIKGKYTPVDYYGRKGEETDFISQFVIQLQKELKYVPSAYDSEKNYFTKTIDNTIEEVVNQAKKDFDKAIKETVLKESYKYSIEKLSKALDIKKEELNND